MPQYTVEEEIELLENAGLLTERQAEVWVHREVELTPGYAVADMLDISESTVSDYASDASEKIESARDTIETIEKIRHQAPDAEG